MLSSLTCFHLGRLGYERALKLQHSVVKLLQSSRTCAPHTILLLEHDPVYTIGVRTRDPANDYNEATIAKLQEIGAEFIRTDRGGLITYHGPGQLVAYPILNLRCNQLLGKGIRWYVGALEQTGMDLCARLGLKATVGGRGDVGVWLDSVKKVMAIGLHHSQSIAYHGIALNCTSEPLVWLRQVVPCGLIGKDVTSLSEACGRLVTVDEITTLFIDCLKDNLFGSTHLSKSSTYVDLSSSSRSSSIEDNVLSDVQSRLKFINSDNNSASHSSETVVNQ